MNNDEAINKFHQLIIKLAKSETSIGVEYAMWRPSNDDPSFIKSEITILWSKIYEISKHIQSYIAADILRHLELISDDINRMSLPEGSDSITILSADYEKLIISFSQEKGIRFHFSNRTSYSYRLNFLESYFSFCEAIKKLVDSNEWAEDKDSESAGWWEATIKISTIIEMNGQMEAVGRFFD